MNAIISDKCVHLSKGDVGILFTNMTNPSPKGHLFLFLQYKLFLV